MQPQDSIEVSVVIPCYCSAESLPELLERLVAFFRDRDTSFEILCVDDGSPDNLLEVLKQETAKYPELIVLQHLMNAGQHHAILTGFRHSRGEVVVTMDDDLQHPPEEIDKLLSALDGNDVVIGYPEKKEHKVYRNLGSQLMALIIEWTFSPPPGHKASPFRAVHSQIAKKLGADRSSYPYISGMLLRATRNFAYVPFRHEPRKHGASNYTLVKLVRLAGNLIINYSKVPLQFVAFVGFMVAFLSFISVAWLILSRLGTESAVPGWTSLIVVVSFFGGLQLLAIAMIGEYLTRILNEISGANVPVCRAFASGPEQPTTIPAKSEDQLPESAQAKASEASIQAVNAVVEGAGTDV